MKFPTRQILILSIIVTLCFSLAACKKPGITENAETDYGNSAKFSEDEIISAMDAAREYFEDNFYNCELKRIWHDEEQSDTIVENYLTYGHGAIGHDTFNNVKLENYIALQYDFYVGPYWVAPCFEPDTTYFDRHIVLVRHGSTGVWLPTSGGVG